MAGRRNRAGFTLVELLVALVIAAFAILGIAAFYASTRLDSIQAECQRLAAWQAISRMEQVKARASFDSLQSQTESILLRPLNITAHAATTVTDIVEGELKQVTVTVSWTGGNVSLTGYVARRTY